METATWLSLAFMIGFVIVHFAEKYLKLSVANPRSLWLSMFGGATVAYVFLYLLPELNKYLEVIKEQVEGTWLTLLGDYTYLLALVGLLAYYGLDIMAKAKAKEDRDGRHSGLLSVFTVHISAFFLYNMIIGYLLVREEFSSLWGMAVYFLVLAMHFIATDHTLKELHKEAYNKYGRWFLVGAIAIGWLIGILLKVHEAAVGAAVSLLAGGIIYNVFKDELPGGSAKNYFAFFSGAAAVTLMVLLIME